MWIGGEYKFQGIACTVGEMQFVHQRRPLTVGSQLSFPLEPAFCQPDGEMTIRAKHHQSGTALAKRDLLEVDAIF